MFSFVFSELFFEKKTDKNLLKGVKYCKKKIIKKQDEFLWSMF